MIAQKRTTRKLGAAIHWQPADDAFFRLAEMLRTSRAAAPIYVSQRVLTEVQAHCRGSSHGAHGLLVGELCAEPKTGREYVLIDGVLQAGGRAGNGNGGGHVGGDIQSLVAEAARHGKLPVGWYRGGRGAPPAKVREDIAFHRALFGEPWQVMLVINESERTRATFVRVEPSDGRAYSAPFFELPADGARANGGKLGTVVDWENYQTSDHIVQLEKPFAVPRKAIEAETDRAGWGALVQKITSFEAILGQSPEFASQPRQVPEPVVQSAPAPPEPPRQGTPPEVDRRVSRQAAVAPRGTSSTVAPSRAPSPRPARTGVAAGEARAAARSTRAQGPPPVTFPMLVPPRAPWDRARSHSAARWGAATIVVALIIAIAVMGFRLAP